jgi:tetratricopeptide (TPR) repeat protein
VEEPPRLTAKTGEYIRDSQPRRKSLKDASQWLRIPEQDADMMRDHPFMRLAVRLLALLLVLALSAPISAEADFSDYEPSSLKEIGDMVKKLGLEHEGGLEFYTSTYVVRVKLSGYPTKIGKYASSVLYLMWRSRGIDPELRDIYKYELVVEEEGHSFTLAFQEALMPYLKEEAKPGDELDLYVLLGVYDIDSGRITMLVNEFSALTEAEEYINKGSDFYYKGDYEKALEAYEKATEFNPDIATAWNNKGAALIKLGRLEEALEAYEKATELDPDYSEAWYNMGGILGALGRHEEALEAFEKVIEFHPDDAMAWNNKSVALVNLGRYKESLKAVKKALKLNPDDAMAWNNKGVALAKLGRYKESLKALEKALKLNPDDAVALSYKSFALAKLGRYEQALAAYDRVLKLNPDDASAWYNKACVYALSGDKEKALKNLSTAVNLNNQFKDEAEKDEDLKSLWEDEDFKKLVE